MPSNGSKVVFKYEPLIEDVVNIGSPITFRGEFFTSFYPVNSQQLIHISIGCESKTISPRVNGKPRRDYKLDFNHELTNVYIKAPAQIGILSIYNRQLSKSELIQHFIDYHVPNFTDDEVLI